jgi:sugar-specific transcriptional regulator TrmB
MSLEQLQKAGLTLGEAKVYFALLDVKVATPSRLVVLAKISPSKVYDILQRLIAKGLISFVIHGKKRQYQAAHPERLLEYIHNKEKELAQQEEIIKSTLSELEQRYNQHRDQEGTEIFEGIHGIKTVFEKSLSETKKGDTIFLFGYPKLASEIFDSYNKNFQKQRALRGIRMKSIFDKEAWFWKKREPRKLIQNRYLSEDIITPAFVIIFNNAVGTIIVTKTQKSCILIRNKEVAESYKRYFEMLWKQAVKC